MRAVGNRGPDHIQDLWEGLAFIFIGAVLALMVVGIVVMRGCAEQPMPASLHNPAPAAAAPVPTRNAQSI